VAERPILEVRGMRKRFPGVLALDDVHLTLHAGEVLAVIGENGAGKSTLMKVLAGELDADAGEVRIDGRAVAIGSVTQAVRLGIALIHQELNLADNLDVAANVYLGREPRRWGLIDRKRIYWDTKAILKRVGLECSPRETLSGLSIGRQQMVEICKALSTNARILIMDEPSSSLTQHETEQLFRVVRDLKREGVSVVYISHRLGEVKEVADRVLVLRDGRNAGELRQDEIDHERMVQLMVGRDIAQYYSREEHAGEEAVFRVQDLRLPGRRQFPLSFEIKAGEIVGFAGLVGAGRTELARALFGIDRALSGKVFLDGRELRIRNPRHAIRAGLALVPEDRKLQGLIIEMALRENISLAGLYRMHAAWLVRRRREQELAAEMIGRLDIRTPSAEQVVEYLSGGNQQKVVLAKWLALNPRVLLLDEPTRGVDVGAKEEIYRLVESLAAKGVATMMISSEMQEILGVCDRVIVMHEGSITGELRREELSEEGVMRLATGRTAPA
jgi:ribose transport system ATP-binding protein